MEMPLVDLVLDTSLTQVDPSQILAAKVNLFTQSDALLNEI